MMFHRDTNESTEHTHHEITSLDNQRSYIDRASANQWVDLPVQGNSSTRFGQQGRSFPSEPKFRSNRAVHETTMSMTRYEEKSYPWSREIRPTPSEVNERYPTARLKQPGLRPVSGNLPTDHPIKRQLEDVKGVQADRQTLWMDLINKMGDKWYDPSNRMRKHYEDEMKAGADKRDELVAMIAKLEIGVPLEQIGLSTDYEERRSFQDAPLNERGAQRGSRRPRGYDNRSIRSGRGRHQSLGAQRHGEFARPNIPSTNRMSRPEDQPAQRSRALSMVPATGFRRITRPVSRRAKRKSKAKAQKPQNSEEAIDDEEGGLLVSSDSSSDESIPAVKRVRHSTPARFELLRKPQQNTTITPGRRPQPTWPEEMEEDSEDAEAEREKQRRENTLTARINPDTTMKTLDKKMAALLKRDREARNAGLTDTIDAVTAINNGDDDEFLAIDTDEDTPRPRTHERKKTNRSAAALASYRSQPIETLDLSNTDAQDDWLTTPASTFIPSRHASKRSVSKRQKANDEDDEEQKRGTLGATQVSWNALLAARRARLAGNRVRGGGRGGLN